MSTTQETPGTAEMEARLRAALGARAELVRPEDLAPIAPVVPLRPRWQSPWALLATAAVVLLVLGAVFQGVTGGPRSDEIAPQPDPRTLEQTPELPADVGRDWTLDDSTEPARVDLDGDGTRERVELLTEPTSDDDGRIRLQATLSSTGDQAYGVVELGTTGVVGIQGAIDADGDGDQELVVFANTLEGPVTSFAPAVLDLRDGLLVQVVPEGDGSLLVGGYVAVPGSETPYYDLVHTQSFYIEDGTLVSTRSVDTYARSLSTMQALVPETVVSDRYEWSLDDDGVLRPGEPTCVYREPEGQAMPCTSDTRADLPYVTSESTDTIGVGEQVALEDGGLGYSARLEDGDPPTLVVDGPGADGDVFAVDVPDPRIHTTSPTDLGSDQGASLLVTSASDPDAMQVVVQAPDRAGLMALDPVGDVTLGTGTSADGRAYRSWLTGGGLLVTVVEAEDGAWEAWRWTRVGDQEMAALPWGEICFDDVQDPATGRAC
ncbi:hypothetical protein EUA93_18785 [Nocardioides oleivorans]|uniref:Uncharacterized protein n=1 Tax=Nocardioides oleivorans TaxID=273676 RepID=A0A4Q2RU81_9ACTN|nr:hypothetical protein [Nocardioides oleivorans]RYB90983.1 hypothetical protein EUA93_18785 [Nocardioides oleivorans]